MDVPKLFKIDVWWKIVLWCGIGMVVLGFTFHDAEILSPKKVLGLGFNLTGLGIVFFRANKHINMIGPYGIISTQETKFKPWLKIAAWAFGLLSLAFFILIMIDLLK